MTGITKELIDTLVKIQKIDIETEKLNGILEQVPVRINAIDQQLEKFNSQVDTDASAIADLKKQYRNYESELQLNLGKIKKSEEKLHSVKTNKEYQSSLKEIEDLKAIRSKFEDEMLEFLEKIETAEKDLVIRKQQHKEVAAETNLKKADIQREAEQSKAKLEQLISDRNATAANLDAGMLALFNRVKAKHPNGVAIAEVRDAVCLGCNMNIPPQIYNELQRRDSLKYCPSCERIIFWVKLEERSE
jgi:predicted  nucleic acid-binding Zn-ribbon protein